MNEAFEARAAEILAQMTPEEKAGQVFLAHFPAGDVEELIRTWHPGGFVLFARDFENKSPEELKADTERYNRAANLPLIFSADEEGGTVVRISKFPQYRSEPFLSPKALFAAGGWDGVAAETHEKAQLMKRIGVNVNLAPVCDYSLNEEAYISRRVFGRSPEESARFAETVVRVMNEEGVGCTLKHFPGYGGNSDTHKNMAYDVRPLSVFEEEDLKPFAAGIAAGADCVMVAHNIVRCIDDEYSASLSPAMHRLLREKMGFDGVIVTDSLTMSAIREFTGGKDPCTDAILCGNDLIITSHYVQGMEAVRESVLNGTIPMPLLDAAVMRILKLKLKLRILA